MVFNICIFSKETPKIRIFIGFIKYISIYSMLKWGISLLAHPFLDYFVFIGPNKVNKDTPLLNYFK
jgi:hypothetical protein